jgi:ADP-dependent phosphofructokinase/glucokinase
VADTAASSKALKTAVVHLELASVASTDFLEKISTRVVPFMDSLGLNEQELGHVFFALTPSLSEGASGEARAVRRPTSLDDSLDSPFSLFF